MKFQTIVPICYWPTTVVIIDDEADFLKSTVDVLQHQSFIKTFIKPEEGISFLNKVKPKNLLKDFLANEPDDHNDAITNMIEDTSKLHLKAYEDNRFDLITVVVMDYNFPKQNGLHYIKKIQDPILQKILLTGYAKPEEVIQAFNDRLIDKYIGKYNADSTEKLLDEINILKASYFEEVSLVHLHPDTKLFTLLSDPKFIKFFNTLIDTNEIAEFYLLDPTGSFLFIDASGKMSILAITNAEFIEGLDMLFDECTELSQEWITAITQKSKIPFFIGTVPHVSKWPGYIHDSLRIKGTDILYALISDINKYHLSAVKPHPKLGLPLI